MHSGVSEVIKFFSKFLSNYGLKQVCYIFKNFAKLVVAKKFKIGALNDQLPKNGLFDRINLFYNKFDQNLATLIKSNVKDGSSNIKELTKLMKLFLRMYLLSEFLRFNNDL
jgi:hypothetical protein